MNPLLRLFLVLAFFATCLWIVDHYIPTTPMAVADGACEAVQK